MKKLQLILFAIVGILSMITTGCIEDGFTYNSSDVLAFSCDTLKFDTVFTEVGTSTRKFVVYNHNKKMLNISSIKMRGGAAKAKFYLNVDGIKGTEFKDVEVRGDDSIFVFVEAYVDPTNANTPVAIEDQVQFITNGVQQNILVTAAGQDVTIYYAKEITADTHLTADKPYLIFDSLTVAPGAVLTVDPGATIYFHDKAKINVKGQLIAKGTKEMPINFRGDRLDNVVGDIGYDIMSGQWGGIRLFNESFGNEMQYVSMRGSSWGVDIDSTSVDKMKLHLFNSVLHNSSGSVLTSRYAWVEAEGTEFSDAKGSVVSLIGGKAKMIQCTFANYYLFGAISGSIVNLSYLLPADKKALPLMEANFDNCIIYGNIGELNISDLTGASVYLRNCLLKSKGSDDSNFFTCKWSADPKYYTVREKYIFDYRLKNKSDAIAAGNRALCPESARYDRYGVDRFMRDGIDIGAYTWVENTKEDSK